MLLPLPETFFPGLLGQILLNFTYLGLNVIPVTSTPAHSR